MDTLFFLGSKFFWALVMPANLGVLLLLGGGAIYALWRKRFGAWVMGAGVLVFGVFGVFNTGHALLYRLETRVPMVTAEALPQRVDGVLVLGGAVNARVSHWTNSPQFNEAADRIMAAHIITSRYPDARIVFSGGSGLVSGGGMNEADAMRQYFEDIGNNSHNIVYEDRSRNTVENIHNSFKLVNPAPEEVWILVTSAFHMPRSLGIAEKLGWNLMAYPVDYRSQGSYNVIPARLDVLDNLYASNVSIRELIGLLAYKLTGRL